MVSFEVYHERTIVSQSEVHTALFLPVLRCTYRIDSVQWVRSILSYMKHMASWFGRARTQPPNLSNSARVTGIRKRDKSRWQNTHSSILGLPTGSTKKMRNILLKIMALQMRFPRIFLVFIQILVTRQSTHTNTFIGMSTISVLINLNLNFELFSYVHRAPFFICHAQFKHILRQSFTRTVRTSTQLTLHSNSKFKRSARSVINGL